MTEDRTDKAADRATDALTAIFGEPEPATLFSEPLQHGDDLLITASAWDRAGGFGFGGGSGVDGDGGAGAGGGGSSSGRPVAVIRIGPDGVEVTPVLDLTKVAVTALISGAAFWRIMRSLNG